MIYNWYEGTIKKESTVKFLIHFKCFTFCSCQLQQILYTVQMGLLFLLISDLQPKGILKNVLMANPRPVTISICTKDNSMSVYEKTVIPKRRPVQMWNASHAISGNVQRKGYWSCRYYSIIFHITQLVRMQWQRLFNATGHVRFTHQKVNSLASCLIIQRLCRMNCFFCLKTVN